jgi:BCD family chlorophyll transporter-like MFS transporter
VSEVGVARTRRSWPSLAAQLGVRLLPIRDIVSDEMPIRRLLRLSMFQVSVGMSVALVVGTLNRVMIVELGVPARLVAIVVALPLMLAPMRALVGFRSDTHRSALGWRRVPYLWLGTMMQFGGLAMMPFALLLLSGYHMAHPPPPLAGPLAAAFAFLLIGAGLHTVQTVGLALATDIAPARSRAQVVTVLCLMLLVGVLLSSLIFGFLLRDFSELRLIQVVQGSATVVVALNCVALWKQEPRRRPEAQAAEPPRFGAAWRALLAEPYGKRRLLAVGVGTVGFSLQDVLLEPYGGQVLGLSVGQTTALTALLAAGGLAGFGVGGWKLSHGADRFRLAALGALAGSVAFVFLMLSAPMRSGAMFAGGVGAIGFGGALFLLGTLSGAMERGGRHSVGLALGQWGAVQAFAAGSAIALGGILRDAVGGFAARGGLGTAMTGPATGYEAVYLLEMVLLFAAMIVLGPLVRFSLSPAANGSEISVEGSR